MSTLRILLIKHDLKDQDTLNKGVELVKSQLQGIGFTPIFDVYSDTKPLKSVPFLGASSEVKSGYMVDPNDIAYYERLYGDHDITCLVYDATHITPNGTNPSDSGEYIQIPAQWYGNSPEVFTQYFLHELCHEMFWKYSRPDVTHSFYTSKFAQVPDGMTKYYLDLLKQFVDTKPVVTIKRKYTTYGVYGELTVGDFKCKTLELPWFENKRNVSCIPEGVYAIKKIFWIKKGKYVYTLQNVPNRDGIYIHSANYTNEINGCIALGDAHMDINHDGQLDIVNSRKTIDAFMAYLKGKDATLVITH